MIKNWSCPKKQAAREATLFHDLGDKQYWSMAGLCEGPGCEADQLSHIPPSQFHGVDHDGEVIERNRLAYPHHNWHHSDFYWAMARYRGFNPGLVNADLVQTVNVAGQYVARIMALLSRFEVTLVVNFVLGYRNRKPHTGDYVLTQLGRRPQFQWAMRSGWSYDGRYYEYPGTGERSTTVMGSFVFQRCSMAVAA